MIKKQKTLPKFVGIEHGDFELENGNSQQKIDWEHERKTLPRWVQSFWDWDDLLFTCCGLYMLTHMGLP